MEFAGGGGMRSPKVLTRRAYGHRSSVRVRLWPIGVTCGCPPRGTRMRHQPAWRGHEL